MCVCGRVLCGYMNPGGTPYSCATAKPVGWVVDKPTARCVDVNALTSRDRAAPKTPSTEVLPVRLPLLPIPSTPPTKAYEENRGIFETELHKDGQSNTKSTGSHNGGGLDVKLWELR